MKTSFKKSTVAALAVLIAFAFAGCGDSTTTTATPSGAKVLFDINGATSGVNKTVLMPTSAPTDFNDTAVLWYDINTTRNLCDAETCRVGVDNEIVLTIRDTFSIDDLASRYDLMIQKDIGCDFGCERYIVTVSQPGDTTAMCNMLSGNEAAVIYAEPDYWLDRGDYGVNKIIE